MPSDNPGHQPKVIPCNYSVPYLTLGDSLEMCHVNSPNSSTNGDGRPLLVESSRHPELMGWVEEG